MLAAPFVDVPHRASPGTVLSQEPSTNEPAPAGTSAGPNVTPAFSSVDPATSKSMPYSRNPNSPANTPPPKPWPRYRPLCRVDRPTAPDRRYPRAPQACLKRNRRKCQDFLRTCEKITKCRVAAGFLAWPRREGGGNTRGGLVPPEQRRSSQKTRNPVGSAF
jgi:hypothetical protein